MSNDFRETKLRIFGVERIVRTERAGSVKQLEAAHMKAVKAAIDNGRQAKLDAEYADMVSAAQEPVADREGFPGSGERSRRRALENAEMWHHTYGTAKPVKAISSAYVGARKGFPKASCGKPIPEYLVEIAPGHYATAEAAQSLGAEELSDEVLPGLELRRYGKKWVLCHVLSVTEERPNVHLGPVFKTRERAREVALTEMVHLDWTRSMEELMADPAAGPTVRLIKWREFVAASKRNDWAEDKVREAEAELAALAHTLAA
ncbi:hypothetical protein [Streptomyces sp. NPDC088554]|uniref:hypothetical protein n=1 Tax=Streptomyces sp. NPDC088554 TaxID=3365865 RepID=UPI003820D478